jgi:crotonobetainyl-CoA:carnitine CoA-transferase CaiB-like acyl-CoA transferase
MSAAKRKAGKTTKRGPKSPAKPTAKSVRKSAPKAAAKSPTKTGGRQFQPLAGVRVLDLTKVLAGPLCTQYLADMGADVIKIEAVQGGDDTRAWEPLVGEEGAGQDGAMFMAANRNKKSLALDMKTAKGRDIVRQLAREADIFVESFGTGVVQRLGVDYKAIRRVNPAIIYVSVSGYGRDGPLAHLPGYDAMLQAFSGIMGLTGEPGSGPVRIGFSPLDQATGMHAALGAVAALFGRDRDKKAPGRRSGQNTPGQKPEGCMLEVSLFETAVGFLCYLAQMVWSTGRLPVRGGSGFEYLCPYQAFAAADGDMMLGIASDNLWRKFCTMAGKPDLGLDPRFRTNTDRVKHRAETVALVGGILCTRTVAEWFEILAKAGIPASPINTVDQVLAHPHTAARGMILDYVHEKMGPLKGVAQPIKAVGRKQSVRLPPPSLGQHSREILSDLGLPRSQVDALIAQGVVGEASD